MNYRRMVSASLVLSGLWVMAVKPAGTDAKTAMLIPQVTTARCAVSPVVDGILTDTCWQTPAMFTNLNVLKQSGRTRPIQAWVARDDAWLYVAMAIPHPSPKHIKRTVREHNGPVHADDSLEIFLDPGTDGVLYFQYMLNTLNVGAEKYVTRKADQVCPGGIPWRSGSALNEKGWSAEVAIPLAFLAAYGDLTKCRMNLNVNLVIPKIDRSQVRVGEEKEWLSWAPVRVSFHETDRFGYLKGVDAPPIRAPFFPQFTDLTVERYRLVGKDYAYGLTMKVASVFAQPGTTLLEIIDRPAAGATAVITQRVEIVGRDKRDLQVNVPVQSLAERTAEVCLRNPDTREIYQSVLLDAKAMTVLKLMTCYLDRSYYTTETQAVAVCEFSLPAEELKRLKVVVRHADGRILSQVSPAFAMMQAPIPIEELSVGDNKLAIELCQGNGEKITWQTVVLVKRQPKPGREWKVDRVNRIFLRNGKPFFGFGVVMANFTEDAAKDIAAAGLNHVSILNFNLKPEQAVEHRRLAEKYGLCLMDYLDGYMNSNAPITFKHGFRNSPLEAAVAKLSEAERGQKWVEFSSNKLQLVKQVIESQSDSPQVMGYFSIDEPGCHPEAPDMPQRGRDLYRAANAADGYHPLFVNFSSYINEGAEWTDWTDVLGTDPYWITGGTIHRGTPNFVSKITRLTDERARVNHQPTWIIPMSAWWSGTHKRMLRPQEQFCQTYLALIHGAKCITYYAHSTLSHQASYDAIRDLAKQMENLGPVMMTPDVPQRLTYDPPPEKDQFPAVQAVLRARPEGGYVLVCANSQYYPADVTFRLTGLAMKADKVREMFAPDKEHPMTDVAFSDSLEPFGVRAYLIGRQTTDDGLPAEALAKAGRQTTEPESRQSEIGNRKSEMVEIAVTTKGYPEKVRAEEPEIPFSGRPGKKNLAPNPSFEEMSLPGIPDYYHNISHLLPGPRIGTPGAPFECVTNQPFHGQYCVQMKGYFDQSKWSAQVRFNLTPKEDQPTRYVLSMYMRADRDGVRAGLHSVYLLGDWKSKHCNLSTNWQRFAIAGTIPAGLDFNSFSFSADTDDSTVWFDAVQFEKGNEPTAFEP